jgi:hypothetical protein
MSDLEMVPSVAPAALRKDSGELVFTVGRAVEVIQALTPSGIAVLGVEVLPGLNVSTYDQYLKAPADERFWPGYVETNNALAEDFVRKNPAPTTAECILTTASWREFCDIRRQAEQRSE